MKKLFLMGLGKRARMSVYESLSERDARVMREWIQAYNEAKEREDKKQAEKVQKENVSEVWVHRCRAKGMGCFVFRTASLLREALPGIARTVQDRERTERNGESN
jgi:hypothetical protein